MNTEEKAINDWVSNILSNPDWIEVGKQFLVLHDVSHHNSNANCVDSQCIIRSPQN